MRPRLAGPAVRSLLALALAAVLWGCMSDGPGRSDADRPGLAEAAAAVPPPPAPPRPEDLPPPLPREFRGAWVATVANIDWPSAPGLPVAQQRAEALAILERARTLGLNAMVLQVRPAGDAIYPSALEPWSEFLTGEQGRAPQPAWDPLAFWVEQAHRRGLELHAWFNPFRARHSLARTPLAAPHQGVRQPQLMRRYGEQLWMDPAEPEAAAHALAVVADVVRRYDIDAVHIDDYFYPYPVPSAGPGSPDLPFPDDAAYARHLKDGGAPGREDWRRANVDRFVQQFQATVRGIKPWVKVGISPFGIGRPDRRPPGVTGFSQYDKLYADVERWLQEGWLDYLAPQLYWPIAREGQPFAPLLDYWVGQNTQGRHVWPGLFTSQVTRGEPLGPRSWPAREIAEQIALQRERGERAAGHIHFSMAALMQDRDGLATRLQQGSYAQPALVPATPWLDDEAPPAPTLRREGAQAVIEPARGEGATRWAVWRRFGSGDGARWRLALHTADERRLALATAEGWPTRLAVHAVDRLGNASPPALLAVPPPPASGASR